MGIDKFTRLAALRPAREVSEEDRAWPDSARHERDDRLAQLLGAGVNRNRYGEHLALRQWYATPEMCVPDADSMALLLPDAADAKACLPLALDTNQWLFLDTETTGLAGGTGTYAFLIGIAWWDADGLQVEQFCMRDLDEEHSVLLELAQRMEERPVLVTFNGKSFDWPLLETRYRMTRAIPAFRPRAHLDLLHPARQIWRLRLGSVRLRDLEERVLCSDARPLDWSREDDIDSSLIPQFYFDYLRGGPAHPLGEVFRHNQMDLRGLATLAGKLLAILANANRAQFAAGCDGMEALGLSRMLRRRGHSARARELYEIALGSPLPRPIKRLAQRELALMAKKEFDYARAVNLWDALRDGETSAHAEPQAPSGRREQAQKELEIAFEAAEQLAMYYEHRVKEPARAMELARGALAQLRTAQHQNRIAAALARKVEARLTRRVQRLEKRLRGALLVQSSRTSRRTSKTRERACGREELRARGGTACS